MKWESLFQKTDFVIANKTTNHMICRELNGGIRKNLNNRSRKPRIKSTHSIISCNRSYCIRNGFINLKWYKTFKILYKVYTNNSIMKEREEKRKEKEPLVRLEQQIVFWEGLKDRKWFEQLIRPLLHIKMLLSMVTFLPKNQYTWQYTFFQFSLSLFVSIFWVWFSLLCFSLKKNRQKQVLFE